MCTFMVLSKWIKYSYFSRGMRAKLLRRPKFFLLFQPSLSLSLYCRINLYCRFFFSSFIPSWLVSIARRILCQIFQDFATTTIIVEESVLCGEFSHNSNQVNVFILFNVMVSLNERMVTFLSLLDFFFFRIMLLNFFFGSYPWPLIS